MGMILPVAGAGAGAVQQRSNNPALCPVCHTAVPPEHPVFKPVVEQDGAISVMTGMQQILCGNCGVVFVVRP